MWRNLSFYLGGLLLVAGALLPLIIPVGASWVFGLGALLFCPVQMLDRYEGSDFVLRRLRRQQLIGAMLLLVTACLLFMHEYRIPPFRGEEWKITLLIASVIEAYTIFRIAHLTQDNGQKGS